MKTSKAIEILEADRAFILGETGEEASTTQALTRAIEHMKRFQWRPIEEAPRDRVDVLSFAKIGNVNYAPAILYFELFEDRGWLCSRTHKKVTTAPTHFMPLPEFDGGSDG